MADFVQTMRNWKRMCKSMGQEDEYSACDKCKLRSFECPPIYERECDGADWGHVENVVTAWAAENPEPTTVYEWLVSLGLLSADMWSISDLHKPIPAEIAQKLGIEPKEGV